MNHIILKEINVADWMKRVMMWTKATYSPFIMGVTALIFWDVFFILQRFCLILPYGKKKCHYTLSVWKHEMSKPIKFLFWVSEVTSLAVSWRWWIMVDASPSETKPSIISTCLKVVWRTEVKPSSGETGGLREVLLRNRLSLWYLVNVIINTVI